MRSSPFDWSKLIAGMREESSCIPPNITFQIVEEREGKRSLHEVKAHKMILAMVSPTFTTMFYATNVGDKTANVIKIEKTTAPAFRIIMDAVYNTRSLEDSFSGKSVHDIFDVLNLIVRYQMAELMEEVKKYLPKYPITEESVLDVAEEAMEYTATFEADAQLVLHACARYIKAKLNDVNSMISYGDAAKNKDQANVFASLVAMMPSECPNCKREICQDGKAVEEDEFSEGLLVTNNSARIDRGMGRVSKVEDYYVSIEPVKPGVTQNGVLGVSWGDARYSKTSDVDGTSWFLFVCN